MNTQKYLNSFVEEHKLINSPQFDNSATRERIDALTETKNQLQQEFTPMTLGQYIVSLHDCTLQNFSAKKQGNSYLIKFSTDAFLYDNDGEKGYVRVDFELTSKKSHREIAHKEVYLFVNNETMKEIGIAFFKEQWSGLTSATIPYDELKISYGQPFEYEQNENNKWVKTALKP